MVLKLSLLAVAFFGANLIISVAALPSKSAEDDLINTKTLAVNSNYTTFNETATSVSNANQTMMDKSRQDEDGDGDDGISGTESGVVPAAPAATGVKVDPGPIQNIFNYLGELTGLLDNGGEPITQGVSTIVKSVAEPLSQIWSTVNATTTKAPLPVVPASVRVPASNPAVAGIAQPLQSQPAVPIAGTTGTAVLPQQPGATVTDGEGDDDDDDDDSRSKANIQ